MTISTGAMAAKKLHAFPMPGMKRCSKCGAVKPISEFGTTVRDGRPRIRPGCRVCVAKAHRSWAKATGRGQGRTRVEHHADIISATFPTATTKVCTKCREEKPRSEFTKFRQTLKHECKACKNQMKSALYARTKEARAPARRAYRLANIDRFRLRAIQNVHRRRAAELAVESTLTDAEWREIAAHYGNRCLKCGATEAITMDHVVPISKGGPHTSDNVQPLCGPCNSSKHTKIIDYRPDRKAVA